LKEQIKRGTTVLLLLLSWPCLADVSGRVTHKGDQALQGCEVALGQATGLTSADGRFELSAPRDQSATTAASDTLQIKCRGFAPKTIKLDGPDVALGDINLKRPNFILIVSDDQGWVQTSTQMDPDDPETKSDYLRTPNIDSLFDDGMRFVRGYSPGTYCLPTRRAIQTSQSTLRHVFNGRPVDEWTAAYKNLVTIPRVLKSVDADYTTAHLGKWDHRFDDPIPESLGYDVSDGATGNGEGNVGSKKRDGRMDKSALNPATDPKLIFDLTRRAAAFMEEQVEADRPFFLQLSHYAIHLAVFFRPATYEEVLTWQKGRNHNIPSFAAMLKDLDDGIGLLQQHIKDLGIDNNTYIIFMADNGGRATQRLTDGAARERLNYPLSAGKHSVYEGGIRVPFGIVGPGIKPNSVSNTVVSGVDILPTIADIVGSELELGDIDGGSIKGLLYRESDAVLRPRPFLVFHDKSGESKSEAKKGDSAEKGDSESALLQGDFKLIKTWKNGVQLSAELYNITKDKEEQFNLSSALPEKTATLGKLLDDYIAEVGGDVTIQTD
jgi:arylsulfatase A-like enzyme